MIAALFLILLGVYLGCGLVLAIPFALVGVKKIDPHAAHGSWGFRLVVIPGTLAFWPLLLRRWIAGMKEPPEEYNAHRRPVPRSSRRKETHSDSHTTRHTPEPLQCQSLLTSTLRSAATEDGSAATREAI